MACCLSDRPKALFCHHIQPEQAAAAHVINRAERGKVVWPHRNIIDVLSDQFSLKCRQTLRHGGTGPHSDTCRSDQSAIITAHKGRCHGNGDHQILAAA